MGIESRELNQTEQARRKGAVTASLLVSVVLMTVKFWAHNMTESQAIFSDAMESIVNVLAALVALWVIWYSAKPADQDHPYGHGKIEFFSAAFEGGLIAFASLLIIGEAVRAWWRGETLHRLGEGLILIGGAAVANLLLGLFLRQRGKALQSIALKASASHVISDFWTSVGVIAGLFIVYFTGWEWADPILAAIVGVWLGWTGFRLVREAVGGLMDEEDPQLLRELADVLTMSLKPGIIQIHHVRMIRSGWYHHIDAHVVMPEYWDVKKVHDVINQFERTVIHNYEFGGEMNFHVDPCRRAYCKVCDVKDCPIRAEKFESAMPVKLEHLRSPVEPVEFVGKRRL
jgi:cation diffusion facilitator family transporter